MRSTQEFRWIPKRLAAMSWDEIQTRSRQEVTKRWDAALFRLGVRRAGPRLDGRPSAPARFFFAPEDLPHLAALLRERFPHEVEQIFEEAGRICRHRFALLGYDLDYGPQIDWHLDAMHRKRAPRRPWFKIRYLDFTEVGDHKVIWELNRHQHLVTLAKAYCLGREDRFVTEILRQWYGWQQENPYPIGINWASSLEVAFRSLSWLWVLHLLADCPALPLGFEIDLRRTLALNGRHIERYLSTYYSPNTHLLGEGVALFFIGTLCAGFPRATAWQRRGWEIILRESERQVRTDGLHFEQSLYYHVYALDLFLHARTLAASNRVLIPPAFDRTLIKMLEVLCAMARAGLPPRFGDDDGGRVFNPRRNLAGHLRDPLAIGAALFGRADFKAAAECLTEEALWLLGPESVTQFDQLGAAPPAASAAFPASGIYVMAGSDPLPQQLVIQAGTPDTPTGGHGHADALSVQLSMNGREWLADPGTLCYVSGGGERDLFRATAAHNTLQVDNLSQAEPAGPFMWQSLPAVQVESWTAGQTFDLFAGSHLGYARLHQPVVHQRWVFHLKSRWWLVRDIAAGEGVHQLELFWHLAPGFSFQDAAAPGALVFRQDEDNGLAFLAPEGHRWSQGVHEGKVSPVYGRQEPSLVVRFDAHLPLPAEFAVLLLPLGKAFGAQLGDVGVLARLEHSANAPSVYGYRYNTPLGCHYMFFAPGEGRWQLGPWSSDARFLYCGAGERGGQHWVLCQGSYAAFGARQAVACKQLVGRCEWLGEGSTGRIFCSDEGAVVDFAFPASLVSSVDR